MRIKNYLALALLPIVSQADLIWSIDLHDPVDPIGPSKTLLITGTLTNSPSSTENLGVIGGTAGDPPGFDYEVGGFASLPVGYNFEWAPDGPESFITQFEGVDLAPGASFDFMFTWLTSDGSVTPGNTYTATLQLQLFDAPRPGPMIGSSTDFVTWTVIEEQTVTIDIKPGKDPNNIKPSSRQKFAVAILTEGEFDATQVHPLTVQFGPRIAGEFHNRGHIKDVDRDGDMDLLLHFDTKDTGIQCGATEATLTGQAFNGEVISGTDSITTLKCR